jgi:hypothetical protein
MQHLLFFQKSILIHIAYQTLIVFAYRVIFYFLFVRKANCPITNTCHVLLFTLAHVVPAMDSLAL